MGRRLDAETLELEGGYQRWCAVHGEVLIGADALDITATGWRSHTWSAERWGASDRPTRDLPVLVSPVAVPPHRVLRGVVLGRDGSPLWEEWRGQAAIAVAEAAAGTA